jgi:putative membrane protein
LETAVITYRTPLVVVLFLVSVSLYAQVTSGNPGFGSPDTVGAETGKALPHTNASDQTFIKEASLGGRAEVEAGHLAEQRAASVEVKEFGRRMMADHSKANDALAPLAKANNVPVPKELDMDHQVVRSELSALKGDAFDKAYLRAQITDHQKTAQLLEYEIGAGQSERIKSYAIMTLPTVLDHLEHAQRLLAQLSEAGNRS